MGKFRIGQDVKDKETGFSGEIIGIDPFDKSTKYCIQPLGGTKHNIIPGKWFVEDQLKKLN